MFDHPDWNLQWLEQELMEAENGDFLADVDPELREELELTPEDLFPGNRRAPDFSRMVFVDEKPEAMAYAPLGPRPKRVGGLVLLAGLELLGILLILGWWLL